MLKLYVLTLNVNTEFENAFKQDNSVLNNLDKKKKKKKVQLCYEQKVRRKIGKYGATDVWKMQQSAVKFSFLSVRLQFNLNMSNNLQSDSNRLTTVYNRSHAGNLISELQTKF